MSTSLSQQSQWLDQSPNVLSPISCTFVIPVTEEKNTLALNIHVHLHKKESTAEVADGHVTFVKKKKENQTTITCIFLRLRTFFRNTVVKTALAKLQLTESSPERMLRVYTVTGDGMHG